MTTKEFADTFNTTEAFVLRLKELFSGLENQGLGPDEYGEWRIKSERLCAMVMNQLTITDSTLLEGKL
jgi:hypothetical protein